MKLVSSVYTKVRSKAFICCNKTYVVIKHKTYVVYTDDLIRNGNGRKIFNFIGKSKANYMRSQASICTLLHE